jgi:hypothetical protein
VNELNELNGWNWGKQWKRNYELFLWFFNELELNEMGKKERRALKIGLTKNGTFLWEHFR